MACSRSFLILREVRLLACPILFIINFLFAQSSSEANSSMKSETLIRVFTTLRSLLYNTPIRHWKITEVVSAKLAKRLVGKHHGETMQVEFRGAQLSVPTIDTMMVASLVAQTYEGGTLNVFQVEIRRLAAASASAAHPARFADVGANIGLYSILAAREASGRLRIDAFEPDPKTAVFLTENLRNNGCESVTVHGLAVGRTPGTAVFDNRSPLLSCHHLTRAATEGIPVTVTTLDAVFADDPASVKLIKIDVEGFEPDVIAGAREVIRQASPTVFLEFHPPNLKREGHNPEEFLRSLLQIFPSVVSLDEVTGAVTPVPQDPASWPHHLLSVGANLVLRF